MKIKNSEEIEKSSKGKFTSPPTSDKDQAKAERILLIREWFKTKLNTRQISDDLIFNFITRVYTQQKDLCLDLL